jgi:hypothetical protein
MVTAWEGVRGPKDSDMNLRTLLAVMRLPKVKEGLEPLEKRFTRVLKNTGGDWDAAKDEIRADKECLLAFQCGTANERGDKNLKTYARVVIADIDRLTPEEVAELLPRIKADPHVIDAGISPSGHGVKALFAVSGGPEQQAGNWEAVRQYVLKNYRHEIDPQTKNKERLCFIFRCPLGEPNWNPLRLDPVAEKPKKETPFEAQKRQAAERAANRPSGGEDRDRREGYERNDRGRKPITADLLRELLGRIPSDLRETWLRVTGAVKLWGQETGQEDLAYEIANDWAATSKKYDPDAQEKLWDDLDREDGNDVATVGTIIHLAREHGWKGKLPDSKEYIILPSGNVSFTDFSADIFQRDNIGLYYRGGALCKLVRDNGVARLEVVTPDAFRTRVEKLGLPLMAWRKGRGGDSVLQRALMSVDCAKAVMASEEAREYLPPVSSVVRCPVIVEDERGKLIVLVLSCIG